jgi:amino acid adenylation domain-containing protein
MNVVLPPALDRATLRQQVAALLPMPGTAFADDDNLIEHGIDSLQLMQLVGRWRRAGAAVTFAQLVECPTLDHWARLLHTAAKPAAEAVAEAPAPDDAPFPLTDVQHAYWIGRRDDQPLGGVGCHAYLELDGHGVEPARLEAAWNRLRRHHPMLRAVFDEEGRQRVLPEATAVPLAVHDLRDRLDAGTALEAIRAERDHRRLEVARGEVAGLALSLLPGGATRIHLDIDLLVADVQSLHILLRDLAAAYARQATPAAPAEWSFARYLAGERRRRAPQQERDRAYWQARLDTLPAGPSLPLATAPELMGRPDFRRRIHHLPEAQWSRLRRKAGAHQLTPAVILATAFASVLAQWSAEQDFLLNLPLFDRQLGEPGLDEVIADFTNLLLLRTDLRGGLGFLEQARRIQRQLHADIAHSGYSGVQVQRDMAQRRQAMQSIAPVVFACNLGTPLANDECRAVLGEIGHMISQTPGVWLDHQVYEQDGALQLCWDVVEALFPAGLVDAMFAAYGRLLDWLADDAADWRSPVPSLLPAAQRALRQRVNATAAPMPSGALHDGFFARATAAPDRVALLGAAPVSFGDLADRALRIAALLRAAGVRPGEAVAITLPRGAEQIAGVLGILAAGAAYVPVAVEQPAARRARIHRSAGIRHVLTDAGNAALIGDAAVVDIAAAGAAAPLAAPIARDGTDPAYVIFTSGSTGEPKGVELSHGAALNTVIDINRRFAVGPEDRVLAVSALDFDLSVYDLFGLLGAGGALVMVSEADRREAPAWHRLMRTHRVTLWNSAPALLEMLLATPGALPGLRLAMVSGDWVALDLPARLRDPAPDARFVALGGATEAAIWSNACEVDDVPAHWRSIPYGTPLANQRYRVVDAGGRDCPDWVPGELWIGGAGLASGYRGDAATTAARFPEIGGARWYRTGDLGRYWPDGTLEFLGRIDHQVKIRGHRIELGEVETAMEAHPDVVQAVAIASGERGRQRLTGFYSGAADPAELQRHLATLLPGHAVPAQLLPLGSLPLTPNGKLDRKALAQRAEQQPQEDAGALPQGPVETAIAAIWCELLGLDTLGRHDSFLALGGDSLLATRAVTRLREAGIANAELGRLFAQPVLRDFAAGLTLGTAAPATPRIVPDLEHRAAPFPPTDVQQAYWMGRSTDFALGGVSCHFYTEFEGTGIDLARLEEVWNRLIARHEMLRAVFDQDGRQRILPQVPRFRISVTEAAPGQEDAALAALRNAMSEQVIDPTRWPLFDLRAVRCGRRLRLGISLDNIIIDALSVMILFTEAEMLYADPDAALRPVDVSFRDYVLQVKPPAERQEADMAYWRSRMETLPPGPQLPLARDPATVGKPHFTRREMLLPPARYHAILHRARQHGLTASSVLATAFAEVLGTWSTRSDFTINLTLFDRQEVHPDINNILGDFTSLMLLACRAEPGEAWLDRAARLQRQSVQDLGHSSVSAVRVMREMARRSGTLDVGMPIIFTSALGLRDSLPAMPARPVLGKVWGISQTPQVWLDSQIVERDDGLSITWDVVEALFPAGLVDAMFAAYGRLLDWLADDAADWRSPVPSLLPAAQRALRQRVNATAAPMPSGALHDGFFARATAAPDRVALLGAAPVSFGDLADRALRIAALLRAAGVRPGEAVAITLPRGAEQIAGVLGILAAGAAYVPVAVEQPAARRARIHRSAGIRHVLTDAGNAALIGDAAVVDIAAAGAAAPLAAPIARDGTDPAYVIFTSGSTGEPKGVELSHGAALNTVIDINRRFAVGPEDRVLAVSALDFDLSVYDLFGLLGAGGALVMVSEADRREAPAWHRLMRTHRVTLWNSAPALLEMLLATPGALPGLRLAMVSGDWVALDLPARLRDPAPDARFVALGGATEAAIWSNACEVDDVPAHWRSIPYGTPLANQRYRVVDAGGRDCPDWVPGELWIGGAGLASGYRGDAATTAARFPEIGGARWYRTGDLGRYWPDGTLEFLGRIDHQVKIRGHRIELGEVETAMEAHPDVVQAVAIASGERGRQRLTGFYSGAADPAELQRHLATLLPGHAVPAQLLPLGSLPLTPNGKLDRKALAQRAEQQPQEDAGALPQGPVETAIAAIWCELLGLDTLGRHDSFLALGGDSLLATEMVRLVGRQLGIELSLRQIFAEPSIAALAGHIEARRQDQQSHDIEEGAL